MVANQKRSYGIPTRSGLIPSSLYYSKPSLPSPSQGGMVQTFKESMVGGLGSGIGFNLADRAISSLFGARKVEVQHTNVSNECNDILKLYKDLLSKGEIIPNTIEEKYKKCIQE